MLWTILVVLLVLWLLGLIGGIGGSLIHLLLVVALIVLVVNLKLGKRDAVLIEPHPFSFSGRPHKKSQTAC
jgi:hypothetical protein